MTHTISEHNATPASTSTAERILDAAEEAFAAQGYHASSLRSITNNAGANLAAVNYHFGNKHKLLQAVIQRRLQPLNATRRHELQRILLQATEQGQAPSVEGILRSLVEPTLRFQEQEPGSKAFLTLISRSMATADEEVRRLFLEQVHPLMQDFHQALCQALPHLDSNCVFYRLYFAVGAMHHTMCLEKLGSHLASQSLQAQSTEQLLEYLLSFLVGGMQAP